MRLIKPSTESIKLDLNSPNSILKHIETVGRNCYKSEEKITDDSYIAFVKMLIRKGHYAMLEHNLIPIKIEGLWAQDCFYVLQKLNAQLDEETLETYDTRFINFTDDKNGFIISANLRVYRDLLRFYNKDFFVESIIASLINEGYGIMFEDLNLDFLEEEKVNNIKLTIIKDTSNFSSIEKLYHEFRSVRFICDRGVSHEIVRHRVAAFAQESTRYCNYGKDSHIVFIIPNWFKEENIISSLEGEYCTDPICPCIAEEEVWFRSMCDAEANYNKLVGTIEDPIWIAGRARSVLPNSLKTDIIVTMNLRGWKHFFNMRLPVTAHEQMRELTIPLYEKEFKNLYESM